MKVKFVHSICLKVDNEKNWILHPKVNEGNARLKIMPFSGDIVEVN